MPSHPIYHDPRWKQCRARALERDGYRCVVCRISVRGKGQSRVDHILRVSDGGAPFDPGNCRTLCFRCDNQAHREKGSRGTQRVERFVIADTDERGMPLDPAHHWNAERDAAPQHDRHQDGPKGSIAGG